MQDRDPGAQDRPLLPAVSPAFAVHRSLAIVGSSSGLRAAGHGAAIDAHHEVLRFNGAVTEGFEADVGARTTVQVIGVDIAYLFNPRYLLPTNNPEADEANRHENARRIAAFFPGARIVTFRPDDGTRSPQFGTARYLRSVAPDRPVWYLDEDGPGAAMAYYTANRDLEALGLACRLRHGGPRTGMKIVLRCVLAGVRPTLFGFDVDLTAQTARHYHDDITDDPIRGYADHDVLGEMAVLLEMEQRGLVGIIR